MFPLIDRHFTSILTLFFFLQGLIDCHLSLGTNTVTQHYRYTLVTGDTLTKTGPLPTVSQFSAAMPDPDDTVSVTHLHLKEVLCCEAKQDCEPCLQILIKLQGYLVMLRVSSY